MPKYLVQSEELVDSYETEINHDLGTKGLVKVHQAFIVETPDVGYSVGNAICINESYGEIVMEIEE